MPKREEKEEGERRMKSCLNFSQRKERLKNFSGGKGGEKGGEKRVPIPIGEGFPKKPEKREGN